MTVVRKPMSGVVYPSPEDCAAHETLFEQISMPEAYAKIAAAHGDRAALTDPHGTYTHAEVDDLTTRIAAGLLDVGLKPLDRAIFQISNCRELVLSFVACLKAGIIPVCTLTAHRRAEISYLANHSEARAHFICTDDKFDFAAFADEMRGEAPSLAYTIVARGDVPDRDGAHGVMALADRVDRATAEKRLARIDRDPAQVAVFQLSGGTSGIPKIIPRFHNEYLWQIRTAGSFQGLTHETVSFSAAPMMHNAPIICYWGSTFFAGGEVICMPAPTPEIMADLIHARSPNWMAVPLPLMIRLLESKLVKPEYLAAARHVAPSSPLSMTRLTGGGAVPLYGMTEGIICYGREGDPDVVMQSTVGRPIDPQTTVRIVDPETGEPLPDGTIGEMEFRGPSSTRGYYDAEERNRDAFTADGYCKSGDLMCIHRVDGKLYLSFDGRVKDVVSRGGEKINCQEVERALEQHPAVGTVATVPMPDRVYGERMCAFIIPKPGQTGPDVAEAGKFLETLGLAKFKWPERIEIVSEFPQTGSGKLSKPKLRDMITDMLRRELGAEPVSDG